LRCRLVLVLVLAARAASAQSEPEMSDDPDAQAEVDKSAAELEAVRKAEEKAGLLPAPPGAGAHDALQVGLDGSDPLARDLAAALGGGIDGCPLADPAPAGGASAKLPELLGISEEELRAKYDIPVELNDAVVAYIRLFQTDAREHFTKWLARSGRYIPMMRQILEKQGLPLDLVYLSMIESGFDPLDHSHAGAVGLWQFMPEGGRIYGLRIDYWIDERRNPEKATDAFVHYIGDLKERFGAWPLTLAAFNAGYGAVLRAMQKYNTNDYWELCRHEDGLPWETTLYVPKAMAASIVGENKKLSSELNSILRPSQWIDLINRIDQIPEPSSTSTETSATFENRGTATTSPATRRATGRQRHRTGSPARPPSQLEPEARWRQSRASERPRGEGGAACPAGTGTIRQAAPAASAPITASSSATERAGRWGRSTQSATAAATAKRAKQSSRSR